MRNDRTIKALREMDIPASGYVLVRLRNTPAARLCALSARLTGLCMASSSPFDPFLLENGFVVLDGGLATELEEQGADLTGDLWSAALLAENPALIRDTHLAYYRAGADVSISASYQASFEGFFRKGLDRERAKELFLLSVRLAVEARDQFWLEYQKGPASAAPLPAVVPTSVETTSPPSTITTSKTTGTEAEKIDRQQPLRGSDEVGRRHRRLRPLVAASLGCYGAALADGSEYRGDYADAVGQRGLKDFHIERLELLAGADGVDIILFETIPCLAEARAILSLLQDFRPRVSAVISVSCKDGQHLRSGERVQDFADLIWGRAEEGEEDGIGATTTAVMTPTCVVAVGVNCTAPNHIAAVLRTLTDAARSHSSSQHRSPESRKGSANDCTAASASHGENADTTSPSAKSPEKSERATTSARYGARENLPPIALVAYPNSGEEWDVSSRDWVEGTGLRDVGLGGNKAEERQGAEKFGRMAWEEWHAMGARVLGGCCRTRPAHITEIRRALVSAACAGAQEGDKHRPARNRDP